MQPKLAARLTCDSEPRCEVRGEEANSQTAIELELDRRHVEVLVTELRLENDEVTGLATPVERSEDQDVADSRRRVELFRPGTMSVETVQTSRRQQDMLG